MNEKNATRLQEEILIVVSVKEMNASLKSLNCKYHSLALYILFIADVCVCVCVSNGECNATPLPDMEDIVVCCNGHHINDSIERR